jgi:hypothetical protein
MARHPGSVWLDRNWGNLPNNLWIAANANGVVAENRLFDRLIAELRRLAVDLNDVTIVFVTFDVLQ